MAVNQEDEGHAKQKRECALKHKFIAARPGDVQVKKRHPDRDKCDQGFKRWVMCLTDHLKGTLVQDQSARGTTKASQRGAS